MLNDQAVNDDADSEYGVFGALPYLLAAALLVVIVGGTLILAVAWIQNDPEPLKLLAKAADLLR